MGHLVPRSGPAVLLLAVQKSGESLIHNRIYLCVGALGLGTAGNLPYVSS